MKIAPFYGDEYVTLYHGDALQVLEAIAGSVELAAVVTDPPYASGTRKEAQRSSSGAMLRGERFGSTPIENDQMTTTGFVWLIRNVALLLRPMLIEGGSFLSFIDWRQWPNLVGALEAADLRIQNMIVWDKRSFGMGNGFRNQHELVCHAARGVPEVYDRGTPNVLVGDVAPLVSIAKERPIHHPSPKPVELMERLVQVVAPAGSTILDPFAGAGPTLLAAKRLGIHAIGIESSIDHCRTIVRRLGRETVAEPDSGSLFA